MPTYKALVFDRNRLISWQPIEAADPIAAVKAAVPDCARATKVEIWHGNVRLATVKCADERQPE
jgi:hypothetical protein